MAIFGNKNVHSEFVHNRNLHTSPSVMSTTSSLPYINQSIQFLIGISFGKIRENTILIINHFLIFT